MTSEEVKENYINSRFLVMPNIDEAVEKFQKALNKKGISLSSLKLVESRKNFLLYEYNDILIELNPIDYHGKKSLKEYISNSNYILKPLDETTINLDFTKIRITFLPKLSFENVTNNDLIDMYCKLRDDGYLWNNPKIEDMCKDEEGNCLLLNYRSIVYINDLDLVMCRGYLDAHIQDESELNQIYLKRKKQLEKKELKQKILTKFANIFNS